MNPPNTKKSKVFIARMILGLSFLILAGLLGALESAAQSPLVEYYPHGDPVLCKGCDHFKQDIWKVPFRLKNISAGKVIVYGTRFNEMFDIPGQIQYRSMGTCDWQFPNGSTDEREHWKNLSSMDKNSVVLEPGQSLETEQGIGGHGTARFVPTRRIVFVSTNVGSEPMGVASTSYIEVKQADGSLTYKLVDDTCTPLCTTSLEQSPAIRGIRIGNEIEGLPSAVPDRSSFSSRR